MAGKVNSKMNMLNQALFMLQQREKKEGIGEISFRALIGCKIYNIGFPAK